MNPETRLPRIGIIGGSGLQRLLALTGVRREAFDTPFGAPSDELVLGQLNGVPVAFLQRHGERHRIAPSDINVRANIAALRRAGCTQLLSLSAVGSLEHDCAPGTFVMVDQFIDRTVRRASTFFGPGLVGHVPFSEPVCGRMHAAIGVLAEELALPHRRTGTYVVMEGPQFSTRAESRLHRSFGGTVIGMTAMPEAKLAREAQLCYAMVAMATDYDCGNDAHAPVTARMVSERMVRIAEQANLLVGAACTALYEQRGPCPCGCGSALETAIMTEPARRDPEQLARLAYMLPELLLLPANQG